MIRFVLAGVLSVFSTSCQTLPNSENAVEALLINPSQVTQAELTKVISEALGGRRVTLSTDTFTRSSRTIIERQAMIGPDGNPIMGRDYGKPDHFILMMSGNKCWLYHQQAELFHALEITECAPV